MSYAFTWFIFAVVGITLCVVLWWGLRRRPLTATILLPLVAFWTFTPWEFEAGQYAPMMVVLLFRVLIDPSEAAAGVTATTVLGTVTILLVWSMGWVFFRVLAAKQRRRT